mmetsp:Transcript_6403/g.17365  ORF Transcript_6403/g.17365 Transcript_6403/m.17365 type:complete len:205 (-) Transcript_6403:685-1299(-)
MPSRASSRAWSERSSACQNAWLDAPTCGDGCRLNSASASAAAAMRGERAWTAAQPGPAWATAAWKRASRACAMPARASARLLWKTYSSTSVGHPREAATAWHASAPDVASQHRVTSTSACSMAARAALRVQRARSRSHAHARTSSDSPPASEGAHAMGVGTARRAPHMASSSSSRQADAWRGSHMATSIFADARRRSAAGRTTS